jgi:hypothetical protein
MVCAVIEEREELEPLRWLLFEQRPGELRLADDRAERTNSQFIMIGFGHSNGAVLQPFLHDDVTASAADLNKAILPENPADLLA